MSINQETIAIEKIVSYSSQEKGACHTTQGHKDSTRVSQEAEGMEKIWAIIFTVVPVGGNGQGRVSRLRID